MRAPDIGEVAAIERVSFDNPWTAEMFAQEIQNEFSIPLVFHLDGKLAGYLCCWEVVDEAQLLNIAVHPQFRRQGVGETMMRRLESLCVKSGIQKIILDVARRNVAARRLYCKQGYVVTGFRRRYYAESGDDALVMEKRLRPEALLRGETDGSPLHETPPK
jgi:ribosomal-protein-alanine N-acetyltransferase